MSGKVNQCPGTLHGFRHRILVSQVGFDEPFEVSVRRLDDIGEPHLVSRRTKALT
jgi:hypothetical protein